MTSEPVQGARYSAPMRLSDRADRGPAQARRSSGDHAAQYIKQLIFDGELRANDRVPQDDVAAALGMSRIPVREGLISLERDGWVRSELHRGSFVVGFDEQAVRDHYALFALVFGFAARRALDRDQDGSLAATLEGLCHELSFTDEARVVGHLTLEFHAAIVRTARSPRIEVLLSAMSGLVPGNFFAVVPGTIEVEKQGLQAIAGAIKRRRPSAAAQEYEHMMARHADLVVKLLFERGLFASPEGEGALAEVQE